METVFRRSGLLTALAMLSLALVPTCVTGNVWFSDDFNGYANGSLAGQGEWTGSTSAVRVQTGFIYGSSGKSIKADYVAWGGGDASRAVDCGAGGQGHYIDFEAAMDTASSMPAGENLGFLKVFGTNGLEITRVYFAHQQFKVLTSGGLQVTIRANVAARVWYHIRLGFDLNAGLMDVWVDGNQVVFSTPLYQRSSGVGTITFGQWSGLGSKFTKSETYLDSLNCQSFPVPGAVRVLSPISPWAGWEHSNVAYPCVLFDSATGIYTMYYSGSYACEISDSQWDQWAIGYVTSNDGANWTRPKDNYEPLLYATKLLEGDYLDPETIAQTFDSVAAFGPCVIKDGAGYAMWYTGWNGESVYDSAGITTKTSFRIGYATSPDGLNWTKHPGTAGARSVLGLGQSGQPDSVAVGAPHVLKEGSTYRMWYEGFDGSTWRILYATSPDGSNWTRQGTALSPGATGPDALGARNPVVVFRNGQYELWYQGRGASPPYHRIMRATSPDGLVWTKAADVVTLHPDYPVTDDERILVDSILVDPANGSCQVFFSKEITSWETAHYGTMRTRQFHIYKEAVNP